MSTLKPTSVPSKRLSETINGSALSFKLNNIEGWDGADLTSADFGTVAYAVFRNSAGTLMEIMEIDPSTIASASITINKRGLKFTGDLTTEVAANKLTWVRGDTIIELGSHPPQLFNSYVDLYNEQTITGAKSFPTPTASGHAATKGYVDSLALGGTTTVDKLVEAGNAGEVVAAGNLVYFDTTDNEWKKTDADTLASIYNVKLGIAQGAGVDGGAISGGVLTRGLDSNQTGMTQGDIMYASNTAGGIASTVGTVPRVIGIARTATSLYFDPDFLRVPYVYAADSVGSDSYAITLPEPFGAYFLGMRITFKAGTANTGACTLTVNGGAAKSIKKDVSTDLATGDILQNQIVEVVYDGTNMQVVSLLAYNPILPIVRTYNYADSPATWTKPANLKWIKVELWAGGGGGGSYTNAGGGGGGAYNTKIIDVASLGATETVTIGAGGARGSDGGKSSFGTHCEAYGGAKGSGASNAYGGGGGGQSSVGISEGAGGDPVGGAAGTTGIQSYAGGGGSGTTSPGTGGKSYYGGGGGGAYGGNGGASIYGGGGGAGETGAAGGTSTFGGVGGASNTAGTVPGGGGGGEAAGANGIVIVYEFY